MPNLFTGIGATIANGMRTFGEANYLRAMQEKYGPDWEHQQAVREEQRRISANQERRAQAQEERAAQQSQVAQTASLSQLVANAMEAQPDPTNYEGTMPADFDTSAPGLTPAPPPPPPVDVRGLAASFGLPAGPTDLAVQAGTGAARSSKRNLAAVNAYYRSAADSARSGAAMERLRYGTEHADERARLNREAARSNLTARLQQVDRHFNLAFDQRDAQYAATYSRLVAQGNDRNTAAELARDETERTRMLAVIESAQAKGATDPAVIQSMKDEVEALYGLRQTGPGPVSTAPPPPAARSRRAPAATAAPAADFMVKMPDGRTVPFSSLDAATQADIRRLMGR